MPHIKLSRSVDEILALPKSPPLVTFKEDRNGAVEYALYQYVNKGARTIDIAAQIKLNHYATMNYWFKKYGVYEDPGYERRKLSGSHGFKRTNAFKTQCKELFDAGYTTYASIAREMLCDPSTIMLVAREDGWAPELNRREFKWLVPRNLPENNITEYKQYKLTIYHFSNKIAKIYLSDKDKRKLATKKYDIDHKLSVYEGFNRGIKPLPWQLLCHPANLQVITKDANNIKGKNSDINPKELKAKIKAFEDKYGKVKLPVEIPKIPKYTNKWKNNLLLSPKKQK